MEQFHHGQHVRLRSRELGTYLHAEEDGRGVSLHHRRASMNAAWAVHVYHPPRSQVPYLLLHSAAYGRYLAATDGPAPVAHRGFRVEQRSYNQGEDAVYWTANRTESGDYVLLQHFNLGYLRANGRYLRWNKGASVGHVDGVHNISTMMHWVVEAIPARQVMPRLPRLTELPAVVLPTREIVYVWPDNHGDLITGGRHVFRGRSVYRLRKELARLLNNVQVLGVADLVMCLPTRDGRLFPLVVDLPSDRQRFHVVVVVAGTPLHTRMRYADVDAE
ncbi:uncharacterized protein LOC123408241 [Hordeum vulgare subsp. vulgare]|uniref:DUF569 domain-containing protein n=1 Tax=Hordeum vulgare subsp. vulgare TaxID=112509 RepID=A0A8I7BIE5_HORVV|nr:uncharacterized protein LOC123408241 [Hordeum vulgare subsp. vulgare]KAI4976826.1 hypothetical protein ZWY2020_050433 [Hordeum vulgare]